MNTLCRILDDDEMSAPGAVQRTVGSVSACDTMRKRIPDVAVISYEGMPHNICDILPERCVDDVLTFLRWRFGVP
jgi:hypothetical protein